MAANGRLPGSALVTVQGQIQLEPATATAWRALDSATTAYLQRNISIAAPAGGYRSFAVQAEMRRVSTNGTRSQRAYWNLNGNSGASLAEPGTSNHGLGVCVDVVGTPMDSAFLSLAKKYGFTRPLPTDPNHFLHDGVTAVNGTPSIDYRKLGRYLNSRKLGRTTTTADDGEPGEVFYWLLQTAGNRDGIYEVPPYRIDGKTGPKTESLAVHYWEKIR